MLPSLCFHGVCLGKSCWTPENTCALAKTYCPPPNKPGACAFPRPLSHPVVTSIARARTGGRPTRTHTHAGLHLLQMHGVTMHASTNPSAHPRQPVTPARVTPLVTCLPPKTADPASPQHTCTLCSPSRAPTAQARWPGATARPPSRHTPAAPRLQLPRVAHRLRSVPRRCEPAARLQRGQDKSGVINHASGGAEAQRLAGRRSFKRAHAAASHCPQRRGCVWKGQLPQHAALQNSAAGTLSPIADGHALCAHRCAFQSRAAV
jgi:hypothetical protein